MSQVADSGLTVCDGQGRTSRSEVNACDQIIREVEERMLVKYSYSVFSSEIWL